MLVPKPHRNWLIEEARYYYRQGLRLGFTDYFDHRVWECLFQSVWEFDDE
jgi:hypothetical protein